MNYSKLLCKMSLGLMLLGVGIFAQDSKKMTLIGNYGKGEGESKGVFAAGSIVYYGLGNKIQIASFSNPASPVKIGSVTLSDVVECLVRTSINSNQYLAVSGGSEMWLINVQNPTAPVLVSTMDLGSGSTGEGIATSGTYAYVAAGGSGFQIYDISVPSNPQMVASIDSLAYCESVIISGQYAYIAAGSRSHIVDISNPAAPVYVSQFPAYGGYHQYLNVRSGYAYVCNYDEGFAVVNVNNPSSPANVIAIPSGYRTACIQFDGNYAYVAIGDSGMAVYDVSNPASPVLHSKIKTTGRAAFLSYGAVSIGGVATGHIFISNRNPAPGISAINVSDPGNPTTSSFLAALAAPTGTAFCPFYSNGNVYVAYGTAGLRIVDVSNASNPTLLGTANLGGDSRAVTVVGSYAYVAARDSGVYVVDVSNPASPVKVKTIKTPSARGITSNSANVFVAASDSGVGIIDISNPANATVVKYTGSSVYGENVELNGSILGLTDYGQITFYDISTPTAPIKKGSTGPFTIGDEGFAISGNYAYVPDGDSMKIYDISNLNSPSMVSTIKTGGYGYVSFVTSNYCYVASEATGVRAINVSDPTKPVEDGYYDGVPQSRGLTANGAYVYVAEKTDGLTVYSNDNLTSVSNKGLGVPNEFILNQNYPNPFNPTTEISFNLPQPSSVTLEIFNSIGQRVGILVNEKMQSGFHSVQFNASLLSSGVYLYRLQANGLTVSKKMMLVK